MKHTILFLAANPSGTDRLALDREARAIQKELESAGHRDYFKLETRWAAEPLDLLRELRKLKPTVVHFSGHGSGNAARDHRSGQAMQRDVVAGDVGPHRGEPSYGLFFQGTDGRRQVVSTSAISETFGAAGASVKLVVLSACYTETQAEALLAHVDCVVGMGGSIHDDAARNFAIGFYGGLGEREPVQAAYRQGRAAINLQGLPDADRPRLKVRAGLDASRLVLTARVAEALEETVPDPAVPQAMLRNARNRSAVWIGGLLLLAVATVGLTYAMRNSEQRREPEATGVSRTAHTMMDARIEPLLPEQGATTRIGTDGPVAPAKEKRPASPRKTLSPRNTEPVGEGGEPGPRRAPERVIEARPSEVASDPAPVKSEVPAIDPELVKKVTGRRKMYSETLWVTPQDQETAHKYALLMKDLIATGDADLGCQAIKDWQRYSTSDCRWVSGEILELVAPKLDALNQQCGVTSLTRQELMRCAR